MTITQITIEGWAALVEFDEADMTIDLSIDDLLKLAATAKQMPMPEPTELFLHNISFLADKGAEQMAWREGIKAEYAKVFGAING